ncbi:hypothetical protein G8764_07955 [Pseudomaricurvus alcaniphilus]|uniref:hypothetical protein n=1 Tax=Pseudomaricurvus alcaniphilus TaxID=1166482 RepID=UPI00140ACEB9|nr:hypothetical protein [Pseudomaricurvus alcaniphilus]NHN37219.1 hypothetical protein [Pseudomaricurvus alcaniphilus]
MDLNSLQVGLQNDLQNANLLGGGLVCRPMVLYPIDFKENNKSYWGGLKLAMHYQKVLKMRNR